MQTLRIRFNVFGMPITVERQGNGWKPYHPGSNGTRRLADFAIPDDVEENQLAQYLGDLFHEHARPGRDEVIRLD